METASPTTPTRRRRRPKVTIVMLAVVLAVGIAIAGRMMRPGSNTLPAGTSAFANGNGVDFRSPDGLYTARFPKSPTTTRDAEQLAQYAVTINSATLTTGDYEIATASITLPDTPAGALGTQLLDDAMNSGISQVGGTAAQVVSLTRGGLPARAATFKGPDGFEAKGLVMLDGKWLFEMLVHARMGTAKLFDALNQSFQPATVSSS